ncbi:hypothetical protein AALP_AA1G274700 [Arabis alpina]|uniref:X8 domain-containing protein n=1 Tax=Arabis alpina TaxID=50452 RepID=A0A087HR18_ARAAL|nr:hypothetical protein AALP_AA1G274700 [Arabis alpina]
MVTYSNAAICVCKDGSDLALQKVIDYACGSGADCTMIQQTGACFQPNTVKNHCDVAVNSFYQSKASTGATCDFNGAAFIPTSPPSNSSSSCLSSSGSTGTPIILAPPSGNSTTGNSTNGTPSIGTPSIVMPNSSSTPSTFPENAMGPSGSSGFDPSGGEELSVRTTTIIVLTTIAAVALGV